MRQAIGIIIWDRLSLSISTPSPNFRYRARDQARSQQTPAGGSEDQLITSQLGPLLPEISNYKYSSTLA